MQLVPPIRLESGAAPRRNYNPIQRWPNRDGYRTAERMSDVALMPADEVPETTVRWLWPGTIPIGHLTLVAGEPGSGKSFWMADLAARVTFARPWPYAGWHGRETGHNGGRETGHNGGRETGHNGGRETGHNGGRETGHNEIENPKSKIQNPIQGSVVFVNSDDSFTDIEQPRLSAADAQLPMVGLMRRMPPGSRFTQYNSVGSVDDRLRALEQAIKEAGDCKLAIVDDLARFVRNGQGKVTRADLTLALETLKCLAAECDVALIVVWRLERTGRAAARYLESFLPSAATAWLVGGDPYRPELRWVVPLRNQFGPLPEPMAFHLADNRLVWHAPPAKVPSDVLAAFVRKSERRVEREQAGRWALARLAEGAVEANEFWDDAEAYGFSRRTVRRALVDLGLKPTKVGNDGPWFWGGKGKAEGERQKAETPTDNETRRQEDMPLEDGQLAEDRRVGQASLRAPAHQGDETEQADDQTSRQGNTETRRGVDGACEDGRLSEDGQLAHEREAMPPEGGEVDENHAGANGDERTVIVVLHRNVPVAAPTSEEGQANPHQQTQTSGP